ncbi:MAG: magnesium transporter [Candidatus Bathyarchaeota archaeon]|nr:MAG: magnesium transporter [Candidatus Bathyarchaeota archaeon]
MNDIGPKRPFYRSVTVQTLIAISFNSMSILAGGLISLFAPQFEAAPWILALFPPILTIRGGIGGVFSGNLATMLHLGLIRPQVRDNTPVFRQLIGSIFVITLVDTLTMGFFSFVLNLATGNVSLSHAFIFAVVPPVACAMALAVSIPLTILIAIATFRRGLDPDILVYPILASVNDIIVTATFVVTVLLVLVGGFSHLALWGFFLLIVASTAAIAWSYRHVEFFFKTIREGATIVIMSSLFGSVNGVFLAGLRGSLLRYPGVLTVYPALTNALGNIGSIIGSTSTTSLALGYGRGFAEEVKGSASTILQVESVAFFMHAVFGVIAYLLVRATQSGADLLSLVGVALISNAVSFLPITLVALVVAHQAFKRGLNPDNVAIPVITSISDTVATLTLIIAIYALSLLGII